MSEPSLWIVGDWRHADFSAALNWLNELPRCTAFDDPSLVINSRSVDPHAILFVQSRPGQLSSEQVEHLHRAAPLARLVALVGPWCEGEMRSGHPWPGVSRVPWRAWRQRLPGELGLVGNNGSVRSALARTATETERLEHALRWPRSQPPALAPALVCTNRKDRFDAIAEALLQLGRQATCSLDSICQPDLLIFDGWDQATDMPRTSDSNKLLLLDFPRPEDHARALALGLDAVLGLPLLLADLAMAMDRPQNSPS